MTETETPCSTEEWMRDKNEYRAVGISESCPTQIFSVTLKKALMGLFLLVHF